MQRYPLIAAAIASPTPVLPEVGSTIVPPGRSFPSRSAASSIASPIRSFTEPPGFRYSSFARSSPGTSRLRRSRRTIGVLPTSSRTDGYARRAIAAQAYCVPFRSRIRTTADGRGQAGCNPRCMKRNVEHRPLCTLELVAEGHAARCPGADCPFWDRGCALARIEHELAGRPEVAAVLLGLRRG